MALPSKVSVVIPFLSQHASFVIRDLPGALTDNAKLVLSRNLLVHGLFMVEEIGDPTEERVASKDEKKRKEVDDFLALVDPLAGGGGQIG